MQQSQERDDYILESLRQAAPMIQNLAIRYTDDYDELYQVAAEATLKWHNKAQQATNPRAYLHRAIRSTILTYVGATNGGKQTLANHYRIMSLDAPQYTDSNQSFYDLLDTTLPPIEGEPPNYERLYAILDALPEIYRKVICMRFGLCGYGVHRPCEIAQILGISQKTEAYRFQHAKAMLRQYTELLDLVQSHTPERN